MKNINETYKTPDVSIEKYLSLVLYWSGIFKILALISYLTNLVATNGVTYDFALFIVQNPNLLIVVIFNLILGLILFFASFMFSNDVETKLGRGLVLCALLLLVYFIVTFIGIISLPIFLSLVASIIYVGILTFNKLIYFLEYFISDKSNVSRDIYKVEVKKIIFLVGLILFLLRVIFPVYECQVSLFNNNTRICHKGVVSSFSLNPPEFHTQDGKSLLMYEASVFRTFSQSFFILIIFLSLYLFFNKRKSVFSFPKSSIKSIAIILLGVFIALSILL